MPRAHGQAVYDAVYKMHLEGVPHKEIADRDDPVYTLPGKPHLCEYCVLTIVPHSNGEEVLPDETMDV